MAGFSIYARQNKKGKVYYVQFRKPDGSSPIQVRRSNSRPTLFHIVRAYEGKSVATYKEMGYEIESSENQKVKRWAGQGSLF